MNNEQQQIIDESYKKYQLETWGECDKKWLMELDGMNMRTGEKCKVHRQLAKEEFVNKCKTDNEFSEKWELKIEERELSLEERLYMVPNHKMIIEDVNSFANFQQKTVKDYLDELSEYIPTRLITITYKDKTIESYEQYR